MAAFNQSQSNLDEEEDPTGLSDADAERHAKCVRVVTHAYPYERGWAENPSKCKKLAFILHLVSHLRGQLYPSTA